MKEETKELIKKLVIVFSPVFTLIMYALPWVSYYVHNYKSYEIVTKASYIDLLRSDLGVFTKIILWVSLVGVFASICVYIVSLVIKSKEKLLVNISSITLVASTGVLFFSSLFKSSNVANTQIWADFMTLPYAALIIYNVVCLVLIFKKSK